MLGASIFPIDLHHVDSGHVLLNFLKIFTTLPIDHIEDMLDLVWTDWAIGLRRMDSKSHLADG